jgi:hypothetical protein
VSTRNPRNPLALRTLGALVVASLALLLPAGAAYAIDPGIHFDPGSPSGKEYAIPLSQGRAEGAGNLNQHGAATPFGVGIRPPGGGGGSGTGGGGGSSTGGGGSGKGAVGGSGLVGNGGSGKVAGGSGGPGAGGSGANAAGRGKGSSSPSSVSDLRGRIADAEHTGGTGIWNLGIVLAVVLPAVLLALLLRRRPKHRPV